MSAELMAAATEAALAIDVSSHGGAFDKALQRFVKILASVPDQGPSALSSDDAKALVMLAENVIRRVEARLSESDDRKGIQKDLAEGIYAVQAALEQIYTWRKHFGR